MVEGIVLDGGCSRYLLPAKPLDRRVSSPYALHLMKLSLIAALDENGRTEVFSTLKEVNQMQDGRVPTIFMRQYYATRKLSKMRL